MAGKHSIGIKNPKIKTKRDLERVSREITELIELSGYDRKILEEINFNMTFKRPIEEIIGKHFEITNDRQDKIRRFVLIAWLKAYLAHIGSDIKVSGYWKYPAQLKKILSEMGAEPSVLAGVNYYRRIKFKGRMGGDTLELDSDVKKELARSRGS